MKRSVVLNVIFIFLLEIALSQNVKVTLTTQNLSQPVGLDSILLEDLTNGSSVMLSALPPLVTSYEIDLSHGSIAYGIDERNDCTEGFSLIVNRPGLLQVKCSFPLNKPVFVTHYNLKGECLASHVFDVVAGNSVITWPFCIQEPGLISFEGGGYQKTFKVSSGCLEGAPSVNSNVMNAKPVKMSVPAGSKSTNTTEFTFTPGDSVRFTVYQLDIYSASIKSLPVNGDSLTLNIWRRCPGAHTVTDYDGNTYTTVRIGTQCWFRENVKSVHYADGVSLNNGTGVGLITWVDTTKYWFNYNDDPQWSVLYGRLYTWYGAARTWSGNINLENQGICPNGCHVLRVSEWQTMEKFLGRSRNGAEDTGWRGTTQGGKLKATTYWKRPNRSATNLTGFTALASGSKSVDGSFSPSILEGAW